VKLGLFALREERRLRAFDNRLLSEIFGPKRDEVTGDWRRLHDEELSGLCFPPNIVRVIQWRSMRWAGHVARMGKTGGAFRVLVGRPEGKKPLERLSHRWEDNIKIYLQEVGCGTLTGLMLLRTWTGCGL
jgi:hypothetical protein